MYTNFYPITFDFDEFHVQRLDSSEGLLSSLRKKYNATHSFFQHGESVYISPFYENLETLGEIIALSLRDDSKVVGSLVKHIFFRTFKEKYPDIIPLDFYPFSFLSRQDKHDIVHDLLPDNLKGKIGFKKQSEIQLRQVEIDGKLSWGLLVNSFYKWVFNINCEELYEEGFDLRNLNIIHSISIPGLENIIAPDESLIGTLVSTDGKTATIETNEGNKDFLLSELFLSKSKYSIENYLKFKLGQSSTKAIFEKIATKDLERYNARNLAGEIQSISSLLSKLTFKNADGFTFTVSSNSNINSRKFQLINPTFVFSYDGYKRSSKNDIGGLSNFGPYDSTTFEIKKPKVLVLCHKNNRGGFSCFMGKLKSGIPNSSWFKTGFIDKYRLTGLEVVIEEINDYSISSYLETIKKAVRLQIDNPFDIAIIESRIDFKTLSPESNPYYHIKAYLMSIGVPVQFVTNDNARRPDNYLDILLNSFSLQLYAKLGGTPWVLPTNANIDKEIIIGIGHSMIRRNKFSKSDQSRIVGITTFFSSDGNYLFGNKCRDVSYDEYFEELLSNLKSSIDELSKKDGWNEGDTIRIVFHIFKPIKNIEAEVVESLISTFYQYNIKYAFVTVSEHHPFILFDRQQAGINANGFLKGEFIPSRGENMIIDEHSCLLQMKGPREIKTVRQGLSKPILIKIHEKSTFRDLNYIVQQIYNFTNLSWRSFLPAQIPVTLYYSNLIASLLSKLRMISGWKPEVINRELKFKKWFL